MTTRLLCLPQQTVMTGLSFSAKHPQHVVHKHLLTAWTGDVLAQIYSCGLSPTPVSSLLLLFLLGCVQCSPSPTQPRSVGMERELPLGSAWQAVLFSRSRILGMSELAQLKVCFMAAGVGVFPFNAATTFPHWHWCFQNSVKSLPPNRKIGLV